jgi:predicted TIM-barrel fold metal-dependent hydrolase
MIIDAHAHAAREYSTAESIRSMANKYSLAKIVLCTSSKNNLDLKEPPNFPFMKSPSSIYLLNRMLRFGYQSFLRDCGDGNQYVFGLRDQVPEIVIPFLWVNPLDPQHLDNLNECIQKYHARGIKLHQAWDPFMIDGREFNRVAEVARAHRLPIFIHLYSRSETKKLLKFVGQYSRVTFIIAHMLGLDIFKEKRYDPTQVYFDTSGSKRVRGRDILEAIDCFGYEHVVFGSDTPYARLEDQIRKIDGLKLSDNIKEHIFRLNIERVLSEGA